MELVRESSLGQVVRIITKRKYFKYPEEQAGGNNVYMQPSAKSLQNSSETAQANNPILVEWYNKDDPANPQNWSTGKKAFIQAQLYTFVVYCGSAIYVPSQQAVMEIFHVNHATASLGLSLYILGYGAGPLIFSPLSEIPVIGRNIPYITTFAIFVILAVPTALVENFAGLLVLRFLTGFMGSPCLATGGATVQDVFSPQQVPYQFAVWIAAAFCGPAIGPTLSGFAVPAQNWRWSLWEILWMSGPVFLLMFIAFPETSADNILLRRAQRMRAVTGNEMYRSQSEIDQAKTSFRALLIKSLLRPLQICIQDPAVLFINIYSSFVYGVYYSYFEVFPLVYIGIYGFNTGEMGLVFLSVIISTAVAMAIYFSWLAFVLQPSVVKHGFKGPESVLVPGLYVALCMPAGLFIFAWTSRHDEHFMVSIVGVMIANAGNFILFQCVFSYLPMTYPQYAASLFAANDFFRSALAAGAVLFSRPMYTNMGIAEGVSLLAGLSFAGVLGIWAIYFFGASLRAKSKFAAG